MIQRITTMLFASALALAVSAQGDYTVSGKVKNADGKKVYLFAGSRGTATADSAVVTNGTFCFKGTIDRPYLPARLSVGNLDYKNKCMWELALEPTALEVVVDCDDPSGVVIKGGKLQDELNAMNDEMKVFYDPIRKLNEELSKGGNRDSIFKLMEPYQKQHSEYSTNFYKQRTKSYFATKYLALHMGRMNYDDLKAAWDNLDPQVQKYGDSAEEIAKELAVLAKVRPGNPAPDFTATDINGKQFTLSTLRGKVVVVDFWASWCVPCRKSNPHMRELYDKYHSRGLDLVYVADDDSKPERWHKAVEQDKLVGEGYHHVLRGMKWDRSKGLEGIDHTNDISDKYAIHFLPTKYLIDKKGNIVCKIDEGEDDKLDAQIEKLLAE
ncbi:MAG: redoxin domain-containing protein [Prevotella sp.]